MKAVSALQKKAEHPRQRKNNTAKRLLVYTVNVHPEQTYRQPGCYQFWAGK
jgi:hypothetical protein